MNLSLDLKEIVMFSSTIVALVATYFRGVSRTDRKMADLKIDIDQRISDYKLDVIKTFVTRSDMGERFTDLKHSIDNIDNKIGAVLDKFDTRIGLLEGRRKNDH